MTSQIVLKRRSALPTTKSALARLERAEARAAAERAAEEEAERAARDAEAAGESVARRMAAAEAAADEAAVDTAEAERTGSIGATPDVGAAERQAGSPADAGDSDAAVPMGAIAGDGTANCPPDFPIKGNRQSRIYHRPGQSSYASTVAEFCFASEEAAEVAGFRASRSRGQRAQP